MNTITAEGMKNKTAKIESLRQAWLKRATKEQEELENLRRDALDKATTSANHLYKKYQVKAVYLYGSLAWGRHFDRRSDIDLLVDGFPITKNYWQMLLELQDIACPAEINAVLSEDASPGLLEKVKRKGLLL